MCVSVIYYLLIFRHDSELSFHVVYVRKNIIDDHGKYITDHTLTIRW